VPAPPGSAAPPEPIGSDANAGDEPDRNPKAIKTSTHRPPKVTPPKRHEPPPPPPPVAVAVDEKDAKALLKQAEVFEKAGAWDDARNVYVKLERLKGWAGRAVYKQAVAALAANDTRSAIALAQKAAAMPGTQVMEAKVLYGDALFRNGEYDRAKSVYVGIRKMLVLADKGRAALAKKISSCNKALKLPENDGVVD